MTDTHSGYLILEEGVGTLIENKTPRNCRGISQILAVLSFLSEAWTFYVKKLSGVIARKIKPSEVITSEVNENKVMCNEVIVIVSEII